MNITDHLAAVNYSAGKPQNYPPKHPCRPKTPLAPVHPDDIGPSAGRHELPQTAQKQPEEHDEESRPRLEIPQIQIWLSNMGHVYKIAIYGWFEGGYFVWNNVLMELMSQRTSTWIPGPTRMLYCSHLMSFTSSVGGFNVEADGYKPQNQEL